MTRVDFYFGADDRFRVACRLAAKAVQQRVRMLVYVPGEDDLQRLDRQLWMHPPTGFIPHCLDGDPIAAETPIVLCRSLDRPPIDDVLVNLDDSVPGIVGRFNRVIEIVSLDEEDRKLARQRFRFYKDRGYPIESHDLAQAR